MRFNELMTGVRQDIAIKIYGENLGTLANKAKEAQGIIEQIDGASDIQVEPTAGLQQMVVKYNRKKMAKFGVNAQTINRAIRTGFAGEHAGYIFEGERKFEIVARLDKAFRQSIDDLRYLYIPLPSGKQIPLHELASIDFEDGPTQISRDNTQRRITIGVNARGRDVETLVKEIQNKLGTSLDLPSGYYLTYGGAFENLQNARSRLLVAVPAALGLIFILLYMTFNSVKQTLLIFTAIPMSVIGGIWALYARGMPFSISAGVGFIALFGVAVLNGIVLIAYFNQLKKEGMTDTIQRIYKGTEVRLRPVIMTAAVASLGFLPMATSTSAGAEVQQPLATVVIGGLITATFLTLIILPILYYYSEKNWAVNFKKSATVAILLIACNFGFAQNQKVSLEEAITIGKRNYPTLKASQLQVAQAQKLTDVKAIHPRSNIYISGEEFNFGENQGVHSVGILQSFNLGKANRSRREVYQQQAELAQKQQDLNEREIAYYISLSYYDYLFQKQLKGYAESLVKSYQDFVTVNQDRFQAGEIGKLPLLTAEDQLKAVEFSLQALEQEQILAQAQFNNWLQSDTLFDTDLDILPLPGDIENEELVNHPLVQYYQQTEQLALARVEVAKSQLSPQLQTGAMLQTVHGNFPNYGYQLGINVPLFSRKGQKVQVEAAEMQVQVQQAQKQAVVRELEIQKKPTHHCYSKDNSIQLST